jgi:hypothetical protein
LLAKGKSPLNYTRSEDTVTADGKVGVQVPPRIQMPDADLPPGWNRDHDGRVYTMVKDDADEDAPSRRVYAAHYPIGTLRPQQPVEEESEGWLVSFVTQKNVRRSNVEVLMPYGALSDLRTMNSALLNQGFGLSRIYQKPFQDLMLSFIEALKDRAVQMSEHLGWSAESGVENAFVYNRTRWNCAGDTPVASANPEMSNLYLPTGTMEPWLKASSLVFDRHRPDLEAIMSVAFAAPLVVLTGHAGLIISAYSNKSGVGKTTSLKVGASTWGDPSRTLAGIETPNYLNKQLTVLRHLPLFYDEARTAQEQSLKMADLLFAVGLGRGKGRLNRAARVQPVENYNTILMAASNNSLFDYIGEHTPTTVAGIMRVFEFKAEYPDMGPLIGVGAAEMLVGALNKNYGWAGLEYAKYLGRNADAVRQEIVAWNTKFTDVLHATPEERFWVGSMVTMRVGALLANKIGITRFDEPKLVKFLVTEFERMRRLRAGSSSDISQTGNLQELVNEYLQSRRGQTVHTDIMRSRINQPVQLLTSERAFREPICVHFADNDKLLRFWQNDFREWLKDKGIGELRSVIDGLKDMGMIAANKTALGSGYKGAKSQVRVWEIDLSKFPDLLE